MAKLRESPGALWKAPENEKTMPDLGTLLSEILHTSIVEKEREELSAMKRQMAESERHHRDSTKHFDAMLTHVSELGKAVRQLVEVQTMTTVRGSLALRECFSGEVFDSTEDEVAVRFEVENQKLEQSYRRSQFIGGRLPRVGDRVSAFACVFVDQVQGQESLAEVLRQDDDYPTFD
jgi:hypothetical protein